jgi:hypothetical protein
VPTKDLLSLLFRQRTEEYSEAILPQIGLRKRRIIVILLKIKRLGYFLWTINPNSKLNKKRNSMRYTMKTNCYVDLEVVLI